MIQTRDPRLPPELRLGVQLKPGEPVFDLFGLIDVPHRHDADKWMAFFGPNTNMVGLALLATAKKSADLVRWRLASIVGEDFFQARILDFDAAKVVVSLIGFREARHTFIAPTPLGSTFQDRPNAKGSKVDLTKDRWRRDIEG